MKFRTSLVISVLLFGAAFRALPQLNLPIYTDLFVNGFQDWSWAPHNSAATAPVHSGTKSISVSATNWQGISFHHADFDSSGYSSFAFWAHGGTTGGQLLRVYGELSGVPQPNYDFASPLAANVWQQFVLPLSVLGVANQPNLSRLNIQLRAGGTTNVYYLDDVQLLPNQIALLQRLADASVPGPTLAAAQGERDKGERQSASDGKHPDGIELRS
jgi:hypothetical protein